MVNTLEKYNSNRVKAGAGVGQAVATDNKQWTTDGRDCWYLDLKRMDYRTAWELQSDLVSARINGSIDKDVFLFLEHPAVFTLGRRGGRDHLLVSEAFLQSSGIPIIQVERGGYITYHGPGQLVVYPIVDLEVAKLRVPDFVDALEEVMLHTVAFWGIAAERNPANRGIWVGSQKMGSIGIALRKGVSFHGLALNVNIDLTPFSWIQPCGLRGVGMTSMQQELDRELPMDDVRNRLQDELQAVFGLTLKAKGLAGLQNHLKDRNSDLVDEFI